MYMYVIMLSILQTIYIIMNLITTVSPCNFHGLHQLEQLLIKTGMLTVPPSISAVCTTLRILSFMQSHITFISDDYFQRCDRLVSMNFACNRLEYFPNISFISDTIGYLDFSHNMIGETGSLLDSTFPNLSALKLQINKMEHFELHHNRMPELELLDISHNHLFHLPNLLSLIKAPRITTDNMYLSLEMAYNAWHCSVEYQWILELLCTDGLILVGTCFDVLSVMYWSHKNSTSRLCDMSRMLCATPSNMNGSSVRNAGKVPSMYRKSSIIRRTRSQNVNVSHLILQMSLSKLF